LEISQNGINLIKKYEGCKLKAYKCPAGIWTIGYGNTYYENKTKVKEGDTITQEQANELLELILIEFVNGVTNMVKTNINQNQFDSLCSFAYNLGLNALKKSTLLLKINTNPSDPTIPAEFAKWNKAGGKVLAGLTKRRKEEADLYCK
jgi:lysozyme